MGTSEEEEGGEEGEGEGEGGESRDVSSGFDVEGEEGR